MLRRILVLALLAVGLASCERAQRYGAVPKNNEVKSKSPSNDKPSYRLGWMAPRTTYDVPIVFVAQGNPEWQLLAKFWNGSPFPAGMATAHLGLPPLQALAALVITEQTAVVKIKVPRGLPNPTPFIPATNPPSLGRWRLGRKLFFERKLKAGAETYSCASCHNPDRGYSDGDAHPIGGTFNTLSLLNVAFNRRQFWDGRVKTLEETLVRGLDDERPISTEQRRERALKHHVWGGFVSSLVAAGYQNEFDRVFGVDHATQDAVAKALATYMRTILSGDSLFDRAEEQRGSKPLSAEHFKAVLDDARALALLDRYEKDRSREEMPALLAKGYELFHGKARCGECHRGPLLADHDYHNVGYLGPEAAPPVGTETGRSAQVPIGLKDPRWIGAFRTPTLRNLARTRPYLHDGSLPSLPRVVEFFDQGVDYTLYLAQALKVGEQPRRLDLTPDERDALVMFLHALEGTPVDPLVLTPPGK